MDAAGSVHDRQESTTGNALVAFLVSASLRQDCLATISARSRFEIRSGRAVVRISGIGIDSGAQPASGVSAHG